MKKIGLKILASVLSLSIICGTPYGGNGLSEVSAKENKISTAGKVSIGLSCGAVLLGIGALAITCYGLSHRNGNNSDVPEKPETNKPDSSGRSNSFTSEFYERAEPIHMLNLDINAPIESRDLDMAIVESGKGQMMSGITDDRLLKEIGKDKKLGIIDAANCGGLGGGGVDGAIFEAMGNDIAVNWIRNNVPVYKNGDRIHEGGALLHSGFRITHKHKNIPYVIQAVSPKLNDENDLKLLFSAYYNSVKLGLANGCESFITPALGMGVFCNNRTKEFGIKCAKVAVQAISKAQKDSNKAATVMFIDHHDDRRNEATIAFFKELRALGARYM